MSDACNGFVRPWPLVIQAALLVNKLNASTKQIHTSNSIALLHLIVFSAGLGIGVMGFPDAGIGFV